MKTKLVNRYYCGSCKKSGCAKASIARHEKGCTNNPNRVCGMCEIADQDQPSLPALIALLPSPTDFGFTMISWKDVPECGYNDYEHPGLNAALDEAMPKLEVASGSDVECPACILAALRQSGIMKHVQSKFDFKKEREEFWTIVNEANMVEEYGYH